MSTFQLLRSGFSPFMFYSAKCPNTEFFSGPCFLVFEPSTKIDSVYLGIQSRYWNYGPEKTPYSRRFSHKVYEYFYHVTGLVLNYFLSWLLYRIAFTVLKLHREEILKCQDSLSVMRKLKKMGRSFFDVEALLGVS